MRKVILVLALLLIMGSIADVGLVYGEVIYTKDGKQIQAKVSELTEDTVWYEITSEDLTEYIGIDLADVEKIVNDDGSPYVYSPAEEEKGESGQ